MKVDGMELDILEVVYEKGRLGYFNGAQSEATQALCAMYPSESEQEYMMVGLQYLLEARYLWPFFEASSKREQRDSARGITPKGIRRMRKLQHPVRTWMRENWFPLAVAAITAGIAVANIVVDIIVNMAPATG